MKYLDLLPWLAGMSLAMAISESENDSCSDNAVAMYLPLSDHAAAQAYCSKQYPPAPASTTTTCATDVPQRRATGWSSNAADIFHYGDDGHSMEPTSPTQLTENSPGPEQDQLLNTLLLQNDSTKSAVCSCILPTPSPQTITVPCKDNEICTASGSCSIERDCHNPARCDASSYCGTSSSGVNLFCHQDTDMPGSGYCMNNGPAGQSCPKDYEDCSSNAECGGQRVCIYSCCREEPFCVDVREYQDHDTVSSAGLSRKRGSSAELHPLGVP